MGNIWRRVASYDKALKIDPNDVATWYNKGNVLLELGKYHEALESFDKALEIDPNDLETWSDRGMAFTKLGNYQEALKSFDKALELDPDFEPALKAKKEILEAKK